MRKDWLQGLNRKKCEANILLCTNWIVRGKVLKGICTLLPEFLEVLEALFFFLIEVYLIYNVVLVQVYNIVIQFINMYIYVIIYM